MMYWCPLAGGQGCIEVHGSFFTPRALAGPLSSAVRVKCRWPAGTAPAVTATGDATLRLRDGQVVTETVAPE
jgi:hypothetical protein